MSDGLDNAPWYVAFLMRVGVPTAFASVLLWFLLTDVTGALAEMTANQATIIHNQGLLIETQRQVTMLIGTHEQTSDALVRTLNALCFNSAQGSREAQTRCEQALRVPR